MSNCEIVQDLLPLYIDEVVSASSIEMIEEHMKTCENCKGELAKLQGDVKVSIEPTQKAEIGALRLFRKKIQRKNVLIACTSVVLAVVLLLGTYVHLDRATIAIPYSDGLIVGVEANPERGVIDVFSRINPAGKEATSIAITENGEVVRLVFIGFRESIISKWKSNNDNDFEHSFRVVYPMTAPQPNPEDKPGSLLIYEPFDRCEIYYINDMSGINPERDYQELRRDGVLLWSGTFE